jgi:hypothetical protein
MGTIEMGDMVHRFNGWNYRYFNDWIAYFWNFKLSPIRKMATKSAEIPRVSAALAGNAETTLAYSGSIIRSRTIETARICSGISGRKTVYWVRWITDIRGNEGDYCGDRLPAVIK